MCLQIITKSHGVQTVSVDCVSCRDNNLYNVSQSQVVKLVGGCGDCRLREVIFNWTIEQITGAGDSQSSVLLPVNDNTTTTGNGKSNLSVRSKILDRRYRYRFHLNVTSKYTRSTGYAFIELGSTPSEPSGGSCTVLTIADDSHPAGIVRAFVDQVRLSSWLLTAACCRPTTLYFSASVAILFRSRNHFECCNNIIWERL